MKKKSSALRAARTTVAAEAACPCGSGQVFSRCHGVLSGPVSSIPPVLAPPPIGRKLDLGCGQSPAEGFEGVDLLASQAAHRIDLFKFPWPFEDSSVAELRACHFVEHIPLRDVEERDIASAPVSSVLGESFIGQDMLFAFFDECWRILVPDGWMYVIVPALRNSRAFQDPTHRRFIPLELFTYLDAGGRKQLQVDHYRARCDFDSSVQGTTQFTYTNDERNLGQLSTEGGLNSPQARRFNESWNVILDFHARLKCRKTQS